MTDSPVEAAPAVPGTTYLVVETDDIGKLQNFLRGLGKTSPLNGGLPGILNTLAVLPSGGASLAWTIPTSGAKLGADAMTRGNIDQLLKLIAAGGNKAALAPTPARVWKSWPATPWRSPRPVWMARAASAARMTASPSSRSSSTGQ